MIDNFALNYYKSLAYKTHAAQKLYHESPARFRVPVCGRRMGKSLMVGRDLGSDLIRIPKSGTRYIAWIVGPTYDLGEREFRVVWDDLIVGKQLGKHPGVRKSYNKQTGSMYMEFPWKSRLEVRSATHPETLIGEALDRAVMSEAAKLSSDTWPRFIRPSLSDKRGRADFPTTPEGQNWLYKIWQLGQNPDEPDFESWNFPTWVNNFAFPGGELDPEILLMKRTMTPEEFLQEVAADFTSFTGKIYQDFDESKHVKKLEFHPEWPNYIAFDFGWSAPFAAVEFQVDPWDRIYIWREYYFPHRTVEEHIVALKNRVNPPGYRLDLCFGDAEDPEACVVLSQKFAPTVSDPLAKVNWAEGINLVKNKIRSYQVGIGDEYGTPVDEPWLYVDHSCPHTIFEFNNYRYKESDKADPVESNKSGAAVRKNNHIMDGLRYGLMHIFKLGANEHLSQLYLPPQQLLTYAANQSNLGLLTIPDYVDEDYTYFSMQDNF